MDIDKLAEARRGNARQDKISDTFEPRLSRAIEDAWRAAAKGLPNPEVPAANDREVAEVLRGLYRAMTRAEAQEIASRFKSGFLWLETKDDLAGFYDRLFEEYMSTYGAQKIGQINETTRRQIARAIEEGLKAGLSVDQIAGNLREIAVSIAQTRAHIIARTETHSAAMWASLQSAKRSTIPLLKQWISVEDGRTRDFGEADGIADDFSHRVMNEVAVPLDDPFEVPTLSGATEPLMFPGDPAGSPGNVINCRCSQVYEMADEVESPKPNPRPEKPAGDNRARLLDKIRGSQPVFSANQAGAFDKSPERLLAAVLKVGDLKGMLRGSGAYADFDKQISMGKHTPGGLDYEHVFRHEYGHVLDDTIAKSKGEGFFGSWVGIKALVADGDELLARRTKTFQGDKVTASAGAIENRRAFYDAIEDIVAVSKLKDMTPDDILRKHIPDVEPASIWALYGSRGGDVYDAARIARAWQERDVAEALAELPLKLSGRRVSHDSPFAGMQDVFEASNGGNVRIAFGHGKAYYTKNNAWMKRAKKAQTIGRRTFNGYHTGQAFANWTDAYGDPNPAAYALYRRLFPRTAEAFEKLVEEFVNA